MAAAAAGAAADPAAAPAAAPVLIDVSLGAAAQLEAVQASADVIAAAATSTKSVSVSHKAKNDRRVKEFEQILVLLFGVACTLEYLNSLNVPGDATKQQLIGSILTAALSHAHKKSPTLSVTVPKELRAAISALYAAGGRFFGLTSITGSRRTRTSKPSSSARARSRSRPASRTRCRPTALTSSSSSRSCAARSR